MIRSFLAGTFVVLAFSSTAYAENYKCAVATYDACRPGDGCSRTTATNGIHYIVEPQAATLTFCKSAKKKDCDAFKAVVDNGSSEIKAAVLAQDRHLLWLTKTNNEFTASWIDPDRKVYTFRGKCVAH